MKLKST